ncbi:unnamed protein product, partial [Anisakis simplex]|uniref:PBPe domain-containing protein n=1 Tax=Anisakis simplex TaxID=6269 RepID=A0A0M3KFV1_ANISI
MLARRSPYYDSSYAYLDVRNQKTGHQRTICVNYEQWRNGKLPETAAEAEELRLGWWGGEVNNTNVCVKNASLTFNQSAVALNYRLEREDGACALPFVATNTSFKDAANYMASFLTDRTKSLSLMWNFADEMMAEQVSVGLLLVEKGRQFVSKWADYLFSEFYDPDMDVTLKLPTFFIYKRVFFDEVVGLSEASPLGSDLSLRFYRPQSSVWDLSMLIVWLLAVFCVGVGGCEERRIAEQDMQADIAPLGLQQQMER